MDQRRKDALKGYREVCATPRLPAMADIDGTTENAATREQQSEPEEPYVAAIVHSHKF